MFGKWFGKKNFPRNDSDEIKLPSSQPIQQKATYERDIREIFTHIISKMQDFHNELRNVKSDMKDVFEHIYESSCENKKQIISTFKDTVKKQEDEVLSSMRLHNEQTSGKMDGIEAIMKKINLDVQELQSKIQADKVARGDQLAQLSKSLSSEIKQPQDTIAKKLKEICESTAQLSRFLNTCADDMKLQQQEFKNIANIIPANVKQMERNLTEELKAFENTTRSSMDITETMKSCFNNFQREFDQQFWKHLDSKKTRQVNMETILQKHKNNMEKRFDKHQKFLHGRFDQLLKMFDNDQNFREFYLNAINDCGFNEIKQSMEEYKSTFEKERNLLMDLDERLRSLSKNFQKVDSQQKLHAKSINSNRNQRLNEFESRNITLPTADSDDSARYPQQNGDERQRPSTFKRYSEVSHEPAVSNTCYDEVGNNSFSSHTFSKILSGSNNLSNDHIHESTRIPVINKFVKTKEVMLMSNNDISDCAKPIGADSHDYTTASFKRPKSTPRYYDMWKENQTISYVKSPQDNLKYDLRSRKRKTSFSSANYDTICSEKNKPPRSIQDIQYADKVPNNIKNCTDEHNHLSINEIYSMPNQPTNARFIPPTPTFQNSVNIANRSPQNGYKQRTQMEMETRSKMSSPCFSVNDLIDRTPMPIRNISNAFPRMQRRNLYHSLTK